MADAAMNAYGRCDSCGARHHLMDLDAKPKRFKGYKGADQLRRLCEAADRGEQFDLLECSKCYGPGYNQDRPQ